MYSVIELSKDEDNPVDPNALTVDIQKNGETGGMEQSDKQTADIPICLLTIPN